MSIRALISAGSWSGIAIGCAAMSFSSFRVANLLACNARGLCSGIVLSFPTAFQLVGVMPSRVENRRSGFRTHLINGDSECRGDISPTDILRLGAESELA